MLCQHGGQVTPTVDDDAGRGWGASVKGLDLRRRRRRRRRRLTGRRRTGKEEKAAPSEFKGRRQQDRPGGVRGAAVAR